MIATMLLQAFQEGFISPNIMEAHSLRSGGPFGLVSCGRRSWHTRCGEAGVCEVGGKREGGLTLAGKTNCLSQLAGIAF